MLTSFLILVKKQIRGFAIIVLLSLSLGWTVNTLRPSGMPWFQEWNSELSCGELPSGVSSLGYEEALSMLENMAGIFVDARDPYAFAEEHIAGAINLPLHQFDRFFPELIGDLYAAPCIVTYCGDVSNPMGEELATGLATKGMTNLCVYSGGMAEWKERGGPVSRSDFTPMVEGEESSG